MTDGKQVACDSQGSLGDQRLSGEFVKVVGDETTLYCFSGTFCLFAPLVKWYQAGCPADAVPKCDADYTHRLWVFNPSLDHPEVFVNVHKSPYPIPLFTPAAMGSGSDYALGALYAGAPLKEAVRIASKLDVYTGGKIKLYDVPAKATRGKTKNAGKLH